MEPDVAALMEQMPLQIEALTLQLNNPQPAQNPAPVQAQAPVPVINAPKPERPPTYSGGRQDNVGAWIFQMERYFRLCPQLPQDNRTSFASTFLTGHAAMWWQSVCEELETQPADSHWEHFTNGLREQFQPINSTKSARTQLDQLKQRTSVLLYNTEFRKIMLQLPHMHEEDRIHAYIKGLKPSVANQVAMQQPETLLQAQRLADTSDTIQFQMRPRNPQTQRPNPRYDPHGPAPMELDAISKLTNEERERLRRMGGCFRCRKPGHLARNCPLPNRQHPHINAIEEGTEESGKE